MSSTTVVPPAVTSYTFEDIVSTQDQLRELMGFPGQRAVDKELTYIDPHAKNFIEHAPFVLAATSGSEGKLDVSPKGDPAGFVKVLNEKTLLVPDRPGNRRLDGFTNLLQNPRIGLIFLIPGVEETLRVNGKAMLVKDQALLDTLSWRDKVPTIAIAVEAEQVYFHCAKAFRRSNLWKPEEWPDRSVVPTLGEILVDQTKITSTAAELDCVLEEAYATTLY
jgi:uncharacterized protein